MRPANFDQCITTLLPLEPLKGLQTLAINCNLPVSRVTHRLAADCVSMATRSLADYDQQIATLVSRVRATQRLATSDQCFALHSKFAAQPSHEPLRGDQHTAALPSLELLRGDQHTAALPSLESPRGDRNFATLPSLEPLRGDQNFATLLIQTSQHCSSSSHPRVPGRSRLPSHPVGTQHYYSLSIHREACGRLRLPSHRDLEARTLRSAHRRLPSLESS